MYIFLSPAQILTGREHDTVTKQITHVTHHCLEDKERKTKAKGKVTIVWCGTHVCNLNTSEEDPLLHGKFKASLGYRRRYV